MFIDKFRTLCEENGKKMRPVAKELGIATTTLTQWLNGTIPRVEQIQRIADYFGVSVDYLISDEEISIRTNDGAKTIFNTLKALPQRWTSLRRGSSVPNDILYKIAQYTNCDMPSLFADETGYQPSGKYDLINIFDYDTLYVILDIMDKCADSEPYRILQIQLSRIVLYHLNIIGVTEESIKEKKHLDTRKLHYIASGEKNRDNTLNYGFNYSDLSCLLEDFAEIPNYQFMFTGIKENPVDLLKGDAELRKKILNL